MSEKGENVIQHHKQISGKIKEIGNVCETHRKEDSTS